MRWKETQPCCRAPSNRGQTMVSPETRVKREVGHLPSKRTSSQCRAPCSQDQTMASPRTRMKRTSSRQHPLPQPWMEIRLAFFFPNFSNSGIFDTSGHSSSRGRRLGTDPKAPLRDCYTATRKICIGLPWAKHVTNRPQLLKKHYRSKFQNLSVELDGALPDGSAMRITLVSSQAVVKVQNLMMSLEIWNLRIAARTHRMMI